MQLKLSCILLFGGIAERICTACWLDCRCDGWFRRRWSKNVLLLILVLKLIELPVKAAVAQQLLVGAHLAQLAFVHDEDGIGPLHG